MITILPESHTDHGIRDAQRDYVLGALDGLTEADVRGGAVVRTIELPAQLGTVPCGLHLNVPDAECYHAARGDRPYTSRMCRRSPRAVHEVTAVVVWHKSQIVLATMHGGPAAPREPGDPGLPESERAESEEFWSRAALSDYAAR